MKNNERLYERVLEVLSSNKKARENGVAILKGTYLTYKMTLKDKKAVKDFFALYDKYQLPSPESILRERRHVALNNPELRGTDHAEEVRYFKFNEYRDRFARRK